MTHRKKQREKEEEGNKMKIGDYHYMTKVVCYFCETYEQFSNENRGVEFEIDVLQFLSSAPL